MAIDLDKHDNIEGNNDAGNNYQPIEEVTVEKQRLFANPFSFSGRIRRLEFGLSFIIFIICVGAIAASAEESSIWGILVIPTYWFLLAQTCKRFHDRDKSGLHILFLFIPIYGYIVLFMQFFSDGDPYENDYGPDPKGRNMYA